MALPTLIPVSNPPVQIKCRRKIVRHDLIKRKVQGYINNLYISTFNILIQI